MHSLKPPALKTERAPSPEDHKIVGERKPLGERDSYPSVLQEGEHQVKGFGGIGQTALSSMTRETVQHPGAGTRNHKAQ